MGSLEKIITAPVPEIKREDLEFLNALSAGAYGSVYKGRWKSKNITVAVKRVFVLEKEAKILSLLRHKNIVQFYGVCSMTPDFCIVTEYCSNGSLYDLLRDKSLDTLSVDHVLDWALDIAEGIHYLHTQTDQLILHRDLKSKNVVITDEWVCKLCDFGTSKVTSIQTTMQTVAGTVPWMSPEMISQKAKITEGTDLWSYAVVLWELLTREVPFKGLSEYKIATMIVEEGVRLTIPDGCPKQLQMLITDCWKASPDDRPRSEEIINRLRAIKSNQILSEETGQFMNDKCNWQPQIDTQLDALKVKEAEITQREQELNKREQLLSQRELQLLQAQQAVTSRSENNSTIEEERIPQWTENEVCQWLTSLHLDVRREQLNVLHAKVREHHINGRRLLLLTDTDLINMGLVSIGYRSQIRFAIRQLAGNSERLRNFPSLADAQKQLKAQADHRRRSAQIQTVEVTVLVGLYSRRVPDSSGQLHVRWKLYVDCDWSDPMDQLSIAEWMTRTSIPEEASASPSDYTDASVFTESVTFCVQNNDPVKCTFVPAYLPHWLDAPATSAAQVRISDRNSLNGIMPDANDNDDQNGPLVVPCNGDVDALNAELHGQSTRVQCVIAFSDMVVQPRNTRFTVEVTDHANPRVLCERRLELTIRCCKSGLSKKRLVIGEQSGSNLRVAGGAVEDFVARSLQHSDSCPRLQGEWQKKSFSDAVHPSIFTPQTPSVPGSSPQPSRAWADVAAQLRSPNANDISTTPSTFKPRKASVPTPSPDTNRPPTFRATMSVEPTDVPTTAIGMFGDLTTAQRRMLNNDETDNPQAVLLRPNTHKRSLSDEMQRPLDLSFHESPSASDNKAQFENASNHVVPTCLSPVDEAGPALPANTAPKNGAVQKQHKKNRKNRRREQQSQVDGATPPTAGANSRRVHGGYGKLLWKG